MLQFSSRVGVCFIWLSQTTLFPLTPLTYWSLNISVTFPLYLYHPRLHPLWCRSWYLYLILREVDAGFNLLFVLWFSCFKDYIAFNILMIGFLDWKESYRKQSWISKDRIMANTWKEWEEPQMSQNIHVISVSVEILKALIYRMQFTTTQLDLTC